MHWICWHISLVWYEWLSHCWLCQAKGVLYLLHLLLLLFVLSTWSYQLRISCIGELHLWDLHVGIRRHVISVVWPGRLSCHHDSILDKVIVIVTDHVDLILQILFLIVQYNLHPAHTVLEFLWWHHSKSLEEIGGVFRVNVLIIDSLHKVFNRHLVLHTLKVVLHEWVNRSEMAHNVFLEVLHFLNVFRAYSVVEV